MDGRVTFRLAHFSDIHYTLSPLQQWRHARGKRLAGCLNYYLGGRGWRFRDAAHRIERLLEDVDAQQVDHALCTGDLTAVAFPEEFEGCAALFGSRLGDPQRWTVIPGNHDRYVMEAVSQRLFESSFGGVCAATFPFEKALSAQIRLFALDVSRPTSFTDSSGLCPPAQLDALAHVLARDELKSQFVVLAMHYGLLRPNGTRDKPHHGIRNDLDLLQRLDSEVAHLDLVLHGHMHTAFSVRTSKRVIHCAGSATDLRVAAGYNIYEIDPARRHVRTHRRVWDEVTGSYVAAVSPDPAG